MRPEARKVMRDLAPNKTDYGTEYTDQVAAVDNTPMYALITIINLLLCILFSILSVFLSGPLKVHY